VFQVKKMRFAVPAALAAAGAALALSACGSSAPAVGQAAPGYGTPAASAPAAAAKAVNPVPIVRQTGATPPAGSVNGNHDVYGDRMASGDFGGESGETVTVYSSSDQASYQAEAARVQPDDSTGVILIPAKLTVVIANAGQGTATTMDGINWTGGTPAQIAQRVGGQVHS
jgi:hypothetical protein